jgi:hypothetical protein
MNKLEKQSALYWQRIIDECVAAARQHLAKPPTHEEYDDDLNEWESRCEIGMSFSRYIRR